MSGSRKPIVRPKPGHLRTVIRESWIKACQQVSDDEDFIRRILQQNGIQVDPPIERALFKPCADLQVGSILPKDFCELAKAWLELGGLKKLYPFLDFLGAI
ncbi:uncharacterized protein Z518_06144 [Rhinocladiella mackenziei CBS 650.93]|uniref:Uncharacterized protein n=1 Tax=Rhinocladiella mackenziei CBS 650.93 TaxID=1442369 RepID=A0A0D2FT30_9EURO|nr:uncharacterized protein Z518_06144 [Rhinocladiella mackenziei CBS 650.93]KIX05272.1 hypothetical protein Z518_06144 [Rhinocladiella mackenziei CBS 650.93]